MNKKICFLALIPIVLLCGFLYARSIIPPTTPEKLIGSWIGYREGDLSFCKLTLEKGKIGYCATAFVRDKAKLYKIKKWSLSRYDLNIELIPIDKGTESIYMKGTTTGWHLNLTVGGTNGNWSRKLKLYRESTFNGHLKKVSDRIARAKKK